LALRDKTGKGKGLFLAEHAGFSEKDNMGSASLKKQRTRAYLSQRAQRTANFIHFVKNTKNNFPRAKPPRVKLKKQAPLDSSARSAYPLPLIFAFLCVFAPLREIHGFMFLTGNRF
jgi:dipeptidase